MTTQAKTVEPSCHLYQGHKYVHSTNQAKDGILARWLWEHSSENEANYIDGGVYQREQLAEHASMQVRGYGR